MACGGGGGNSDVLVARARSGGNHGTEVCGSGGGGSDDGWTPSRAFHEQPLEREETPFFFSQMTARVCGGSLPLL